MAKVDIQWIRDWLVWEGIETEEVETPIHDGEHIRITSENILRLEQLAYYIANKQGQVKNLVDTRDISEEEAFEILRVQVCL